MKRIISTFVIILFFVIVKAQTPPPMVTGLTDPAGVLVIGNELYVSEFGPNSRITKVNLDDPMPATPTIVTTNVITPMGMARKGNYLYFTQYGASKISRINHTLALPVVEDIVISGLNQPTSIAINGNDLYIAEPLSNKVSKISLTATFPTIPTVIVGSLSQPWGLAVYGNKLVISESGAGKISSFDMTAGINPPITAISTTSMNQPKGLTIDGDFLFIADDDANNISKIDLTQAYPIIPAFVTSVMHPQDVIHNNLDLIISEMGTDEVIRRSNPVAIDSITSAGPNITVYTGHADSTMPAGFNNPLSWSGGSVPGPGADLVALPVYGMSIISNISINSLTALDNSFINIHKNVKLASLSQFGVNSIINWVGGTLSGNALLNNRGQINCTTYNMFLYDSLTLANYGGFRFESEGDLYIRNATLHNTASGEIKIDFPDIDIRVASGSSRDSIINEGTILKTDTSLSIISAAIHNTGIIEIENGTIALPRTHYLNHGTFLNIHDGASMYSDYTSAIHLSGVITGSLDGNFTMYSTALYVPSIATIDFSGNNHLQWTDTDIYGSGVLNLKSDISVIGGFTGFNNVRIIEGLTINNEAVFSLTSSISMYLQPGHFNNLATGVIDLQSTGTIYQGSSGSRQLTNYGLIKRSLDTNIVSIGVNVHNLGGTIQVEKGSLQLTNSGSYFNAGTYHVDAAASRLSIVDGTYNGILAGNLVGTLGLINNVKVDSATTATIDFNGPGPIQCSNCIVRGQGTFVNKSNIDVVNSSYYMTIDDGATFNNQGYISFKDGFDLYVEDGTFNNLVLGTIDLQSDAANISYGIFDPNVFNNYGLIKKSGSDGTSTITGTFNNLGGKIQVERGTLSFNGPASRQSTFIGGQYDVDSMNNKLILNGQLNLACLGELTGQLNGTLDWKGSVIVDSATTAIFNFDGTGAIDWTAGYLTGGGTLTSKSDISVATGSGFSAVRQNNGTTLNNEALFTLANGADLNIEDGVFNNNTLGVIDIQATGSDFIYSSSVPQALNNMGLIKKSASTGQSSIHFPTNNTGVIQVDSGTLVFTDTLHNHPNGIIKGIANIDLPPANLYTNEGIYSPGASPGNLHVIGDYESTTAAILDIELDGLMQATEYDVLTVQGDADINGVIELSLGFDPSIGDTFAILMTSGAITSGLPATITATSPTNDIYTFDVQIKANSIVLEVLTDCQTSRLFMSESVSGIYRADADIIATNVDVVAPTVFSAPYVLLTSNFSVPLGEQFEIIQDGCD